MSLNQTTDNSSFSTTGSFCSNFKTISSINLTKETQHLSYDYSANNGLSDKYFSSYNLPIVESNENLEREEDECVARVNQLELKYKKILHDLVQRTRQEAEEYCKIKNECAEKNVLIDNQKQEIEMLYANSAKLQEELANVRRELEMLRSNYNNLDESFLGYEKYKNFDNKHLAVNGSMPGLLGQYKSTGQLNMVNRHNSVILSDLNVMHLSERYKLREDHQSHHHLQPTSYLDTKANQDEMFVSAEDLCEKAQLENGGDKQSSGLFRKLRSRLGRRKTFKA